MADLTPEDIINVGKQQVSRYSGFLPLIVVGLVILLGLQGTIYSIGPEEVGVVQRFGKYTHTTSPGLHFKLPFGIDKVTPIKAKRVFKEEFGFRTIQPGVQTRYSAQKYLDESIMLTGDLNILDVRWIVQFRINDPVNLLFKTRDPIDNIRDTSEVIMRRLTGNYLVDEVLTISREEISDLAQVQIQEILNKYQTGIQVVTVKLLDVNPPDTVKPAFNEVNEAKQEKERMINQAWKNYNKVIPKAKGEAEKTIREAEGYSLDKVNRAKGEAERFSAVLAKYKKAPEITQKRLYLETMMKVLPKAQQKYVIDPKQSSILPLLKIGSGGAE